MPLPPGQLGARLWEEPIAWFRRWPGAAARSGNYFLLREAAGHGAAWRPAIRYAQVSPGEAEGGPAVPRTYSRRPRPRPRGPRSRGLAGARPPPSPRAPALRSASKALRYRGRGQARGAGRWGTALRVPRPGRLTLYVNSGGSAPCSPRRR